MALTTYQKIIKLREDYFYRLNPWCREFVSDLYENCDEDADEQLSMGQIEKVEEIWEDLGFRK